MPTILNLLGTPPLFWFHFLEAFMKKEQASKDTQLCLPAQVPHTSGDKNGLSCKSIPQWLWDFSNKYFFFLCLILAGFCFMFLHSLALVTFLHVITKLEWPNIAKNPKKDNPLQQKKPHQPHSNGFFCNSLIARPCSGVYGLTWFQSKQVQVALSVWKSGS